MFDFFRKSAPVPEAKASAVGPLTAGAPGTSRQAALAAAAGLRWTARDTVSLTRAGFMGNPVAFRAVRLIADTAAVPAAVIATIAPRRSPDTVPYERVISPADSSRSNRLLSPPRVSRVTRIRSRGRDGPSLARRSRTVIDSFDDHSPRPASTTALVAAKPMRLTRSMISRAASSGGGSDGQVSMVVACR